ncbi:YvrJ family protein [Lysinibacillus sp. FSL H8-0500]|uniref:YvrJ family protein n=1 Tax=Lysinibacillus sp. FSL H8-0500 TaxID=2921393 RepID=UPI003100B376
MQELEDFLFQIGNFGFPLVLAIYLLLRFEKKLEKLSNAISNLENTINNKKK